MPRRRSSFRRSSRPADWVYRADITDMVSRGSYIAQQQFTNVQRNDQVLGVFMSNAFILVDSVAFKEMLMVDTLGIGQGLPAAGAPEAHPHKAIRVEGDLTMRLIGWTAGQFYHWGWRLGWFEQDTTSGLLTVQLEYSMFEPHIAGSTVPADIVNFANDKQSNIREKFYMRQHAADVLPIVTERFNMRVNRRAPSSKHCLALYFEVGSDTSINGAVAVYRNLRTLMTADE